MKRIIFYLFVSGIIFLNRGFSAFDDPITTTRGKSMGNAIFADFDGVYSMNYNPSCIAYTRNVESYFAWDTPYLGLNDGSMINTLHFNLVVPFWNSFTIPPDMFFTKEAALGITVRRLSLSGNDIDDVYKEFYHEAIYSFIYAKNLNNLFKGARMSFGARFNVFDIGVGNVIDVENNENFSRLGNISFGLDLGMTYDFSDNIHLGFVYKNLISPNVSILEDGTDTLPAEMRFGGNVDLGNLFGFLKKSKLGAGVVVYGRDANDNRQADMSWNFGYEFRQLTAGDLFKGSLYKDEMLAFRIGFNFESKKVGDEFDLGFTKLKGIANFSAGLGFNYVFGVSHLISIDYAFEMGINMSAFRHTASLTYKYLLPNSAFAYREETKKELEFEELIQKRIEAKKEKEEAEEKKETQKTPVQKK